MIKVKYFDKIKSRTFKIILIAIVCIININLYSCNDITISADFIDELNEITEVLSQYKSLGIITESEYNSYIKHYDNIKNKIEAVVGSDSATASQNVIKELRSNITRVYELGSGDIKFYGKDCSGDLSDYEDVTNLIESKAGGIAKSHKDKTFTITNGASDENGGYSIPIEYYEVGSGHDAVAALGEGSNASLYGKDIEFEQFEIRDGVAVSSYIGALNKYRETGKLNDLTKYGGVSIWDSSGNTTISFGEMFITTSASSWISDGGSGSVSFSYNEDYTVCQTVTLYANVEENGKTVVKTTSVDMPLFDVKINKPDLDMLNRLTGGLPMDGVSSTINDSSKYIYTIGSGSNFVFKLEYPINIINKVKISSQNDSSSLMSIESNAIEYYYFNLGNNSVMFDDGTERIRLIQNGFNMLVSGSTDEDAYSQYSSDTFVTNKSHPNLTGLNSESFEVYDNGTEKVILLTDYFETLYAGEEIGNGSWLVTGRKLRINTDNTNGEHLFAYMDYGNNVSATGSGEPKTLSYRNICSFDSLSSGYDINILSDSLNKTDDGLANQLRSLGANNIFYNFYILGDSNNISYINRVQEIQICDSITNSSIGGVGNLKYSIPIYCIKVLTDDKTESLNSTWISNNNKYNNMSGWLNWLSNNGISYSYDISDIKDKTGFGYEYNSLDNSYDLALDAVAISNIQDRLDEQAKNSYNSTIKSLIVVIGYIVIIWGILLVPAWIIDTNIYVGVELYRVMTFGTYRAVGISEEESGTKVKYKQAGAKQLILTVLLCIAFGNILIYVDYMKIIAQIVIVLSKISEGIEGVITNLR